MSKKLGVALGSGGARGVAHIGVLRALEEEGIKPDYISGCSMGAVVGACYAMGMSLDEMLEDILRLKTSDFVDPTVAILTQQSILKGNKMEKLLKTLIGEVEFSHLKIPFCCVASDLKSGRIVELNAGKVETAVQASSAIPAIFKPVKLDKKILVDGGILCRVPVKQVKDMGADRVLAVDVLHNTGEPVKEVNNVISTLLRVIDMMDHNATVMKRELEKEMCDMLLQPELKGMNQYIVKDLEKAYAEGYSCAKSNIQKIKELIE